VTNLGEVWYSLARGYSGKSAEGVVEEINALGIEAAPADWPPARKAARFKSMGAIAYADCFALALAKIRGVVVVTGDREFEQFGDQVPIHWICSGLQTCKDRSMRAHRIHSFPDSVNKPIAYHNFQRANLQPASRVFPVSRLLARWLPLSGKSRLPAPDGAAAARASIHSCNPNSRLISPLKSR
jgi:hypothetical protein